MAEKNHTLPIGLSEKLSRIAIISSGDHAESFPVSTIGDNRFIADKKISAREFCQGFRLTEVDFTPKSTGYHAGSRKTKKRPSAVPRVDWDRRFSLFSKFDDGIQMDDESWYEVTPENVARYIALKTSRKSRVVDCFCGVGGNAIQFALLHDRVVGVDLSASRLRMTLHNSRLYGVDDRLELAQCDALAYLEGSEFSDESCLYMSPPWGGKKCYKYSSLAISLLPVNLEPLILVGLKRFSSMILHLPRNIDLEGIQTLLGGVGVKYFEVEAVYYSQPKRHLKFYLVFIETSTNVWFSLYERDKRKNRASLVSCIGPCRSAKLMSRTFFGNGLFGGAIQQVLQSHFLRGVTRGSVLD